MIKPPQEIPVRESIEYTYKAPSLPSGPPLVTPMYIKQTPKVVRYYNITYPITVASKYLPISDFSSFRDVHYPHIRKVNSSLHFNHWFNMYRKTYFYTEDHAYIDMFINYKFTILKHPEKYEELRNKYPEYFI